MTTADALANRITDMENRIRALERAVATIAVAAGKLAEDIKATR
jgi:O-acetylhomoserine/O-acetylserine sulfhydrylase-like pyridoxal-dependent enzyme